MVYRGDMDAERYKTYSDSIDQNVVYENDYAEALERLKLAHSSQARRGLWMLVAYGKDTQPAKRLKAKAGAEWIQVETFTRKTRPNREGNENLPYEIWARVEP